MSFIQVFIHTGVCMWRNAVVSAVSLHVNNKLVMNSEQSLCKACS